MNRAERQHRKLLRYEAWLREQIVHEQQLPGSGGADGKRVIRALERDHRRVVAQLELATDAAEALAARVTRAARRR